MLICNDYIHMHVNAYGKSCKGMYESRSKSIEEAELGKGIIRGTGQIPQREYILV